MKKAKESGQMTPEAEANYNSIASELDRVDGLILQATEQPEEKATEQPEEKTEEQPGSYKPARGTERMVHLELTRGRKFDPNTGKPVAKPYVQVFTYSEWQLFKQNFKALGFSIDRVLHDPYNEAEKYLVTEK